MQTTLTYSQCLCCGSAAISRVLTCKDHTVSQESFEIWKCSNCTFRFTQHIPTVDQIAPYYQSDAYVSHSDTKKGLVNRLYHFVRKITLGSKKSLVKKVTGLQKGNLLDVGAGTGAFASQMYKAGWTVTALEPDESARATAMAKYKVQLQDLSKLTDLFPVSFDAITLWHVLEHIHDLNGYLEKFHRLLKPAGRLVVAVPNYCSYDAEKYEEFWAAYDVPRHLYHFSYKSMQTLLEKQGFHIESIKPMWFDSFYVSMLSEKIKEGKQRFLPAFWTGFVSNVKAISENDRCSSIIYIIRKTETGL